MPRGDGIYEITVSGHGNGRFKSLAYLREIAFNCANIYAKDNDAKIEVVSVNETPMALGVFNQIDLRFKLVLNSEKLADPNAPSIKISNSYGANGKATDSEIAIKAAPKKQSDSEKYEKLKQIGELYKNGILSKEEFEAEKAKILGND